MGAAISLPQFPFSETSEKHTFCAHNKSRKQSEINHFVSGSLLKYLIRHTFSLMYMDIVHYLEAKSNREFVEKFRIFWGTGGRGREGEGKGTQAGHDINLTGARVMLSASIRPLQTYIMASLLVFAFPIVHIVHKMLNFWWGERR
ncbi:MAG: hypothetical protein Q4F21_04660 [Lachnospiraceae bacterium]|nr:hypothetical protein [Lachnospiraceae bacterium]